MLCNATLIPLIRSNLNDGQFFAIGISASHNVVNRTSRYYPLGDGWNRGYIKLYRSNNPMNILALEDDCIQHFMSSDFLTNKNGGGGGWIKPEHASWVLYLKLAHRKPSEHWYAKKRPKLFISVK
jgi:hypothetical protein